MVCYWLLTCICVQYILCIHVYVYTYVFVNITSSVCIISLAYGFIVENFTLGNQWVCSSLDKTTSTAPTYNSLNSFEEASLAFPHLVLHVHRCHPSSSHKSYQCWWKLTGVAFDIKGEKISLQIPWSSGSYTLPLLSKYSLWALDIGWFWGSVYWNLAHNSFFCFWFTVVVSIYCKEKFSWRWVETTTLIQIGGNKNKL